MNEQTNPVAPELSPEAKLVASVKEAVKREDEDKANEGRVTEPTKH